MIRNNLASDLKKSFTLLQIINNKALLFSLFNIKQIEYDIKRLCEKKLSATAFFQRNTRHMPIFQINSFFGKLNKRRGI